MNALLRPRRFQNYAALYVPQPGGGDVTPPTITSSAAVSVNENATLAHTLTASEAVTWSVVGGADAALVDIAIFLLRWAGNTTRDFETPADADANNIYEITVRATDAALLTTDQNISITVVNVVEVGDPTAPVNTVLPTVAGTTTQGATLTGTDGTYTGTAPITIEYRWMRAVTSGGVPVGAAGAWVGVEISGATTANYTTVAGDVGEFIFRDERASNAAGNSGWISSATTIGAIVAAGDTTAPILTSPTDAAAGSTTGTGSVSTNEGNGTLYWVVSTSATPPSAAQVKLGQMHTGAAAADSGSQAVSGTGVQTVSGGFSGLTASTAYTAHYMHEDSATNQSSVSSADGFTTSAASGGWTPADLGANLLGWWKADAGVLKAGPAPAGNGDPIIQWSDQSGNGRHLLVPAGFNQGVYLTNTLNSLPVVDLDCAGNFEYLETATESIPLGVATASCFVVMKYTAVSGSARIVGIATTAGGDAASDTAIFMYDSTTSAPKTYNNGNKGVGSIVASSWNQLGTVFDGTDNTFYVNGAAGTTVGATNTFASNVTLRVNGDGGSAGTTGQFAEIIFTNSAITGTDFTDLYDYLLDKWGVG